MSGVAPCSVHGRGTNPTNVLGRQSVVTVVGATEA